MGQLWEARQRVALVPATKVGLSSSSKLEGSNYQLLQVNVAKQAGKGKVIDRTAAFRGTELDFIRPGGEGGWMQFKPMRIDQLEVPTKHTPFLIVPVL